MRVQHSPAVLPVYVQKLQPMTTRIVLMASPCYLWMVHPMLILEMADGGFDCCPSNPRIRHVANDVVKHVSHAERSCFKKAVAIGTSQTNFLG